MRARLTWLWLLVLPISACSGSRSDPVLVEEAGVSLSTSLAPAAGRVGANQLWLRLRDASGRPVEGAQLRVKVYMPSMGAMPAMGGDAGVTDLGEGEFRADFDLEMGGSWRVEIEASSRGAPALRAEGSFTVGSEGLRLSAMPRTAAPVAEPAPGAESHPAEFSFEPARLQKSGVRSGVVERAEIASGVRAVARVVWDETRLHDVSPRVSGWIQELHADSVGKRVERGSVLFTLYSPELHAGQQELLFATRARHGGETFGEDLWRAARERLRLWGMEIQDIERLERERQLIESVPFRSPLSGYVVEKDVVAGGSVTAGQRLLRIAPLDRVWLEADVYESELPLVRVGQPVRVTLPYRPGSSYPGSVSWVYPSLSGPTRTARVRVELSNPELALLPEMYADLEILLDSHDALVVPEDAVLHAGERSFVFLELGAGRFRPQQVEVGIRDAGRVEILAGLVEGQRIVVSGTFLIASESRLRAAIEQW